jgi:hypothetical protein
MILGQALPCTAVHCETLLYRYSVHWYGITYQLRNIRGEAGLALERSDPLHFLYSGPTPGSRIHNCH